jgi:hypothetical protein
VNNKPSALNCVSPAAIVLTLIASAIFSTSAYSETADVSDPAAELQALKDMQALLERLADDHTEQPQEREASLSALARVREALDSWTNSIPYYDKLIGERPTGPVCAWSFSGAIRARIARDGTLAGARAYLAKDALEAALNADDMTNHVHRLKNHIEQISKFLSASASKHGPGIRPMQNVQFVKGEEPSFWKAVAPAWIYPPAPQKPAPNQPPAPVPATALKSVASLTINPLVPDMNKRVNLVAALATVQPDTAKRIVYMNGVAPVQPDLHKRIELIPDQPAAK